MKSKYFKLIFLLCMLSLCNVEANDYFNSEDIHTSEDGFYINYQESIFLVDKISYEKNMGFYIPTDAKIELPKYNSWICPRKDCGRANWTWRSKCYACNGPAPDYREKK